MLDWEDNGKEKYSWESDVDWHERRRGISRRKRDQVATTMGCVSILILVYIAFAAWRGYL